MSSCVSVREAKASDYKAIMALAKEAEPLFGPMAQEEAFQKGMKEAILQRVVFVACISGEVAGAIIVSPELNQILWLVVFEKERCKGCGQALLDRAMAALDSSREVYVQTFSSEAKEGAVARNLYLDLGFEDHEEAGTNPAGVPTVIMRYPSLAV